MWHAGPSHGGIAATSALLQSHRSRAGEVTVGSAQARDKPEVDRVTRCKEDNWDLSLLRLSPPEPKASLARQLLRLGDEQDRPRILVICRSGLQPNDIRSSHSGLR